jgi:hypothetical protein
VKAVFFGFGLGGKSLGALVAKSFNICGVKVRDLCGSHVLGEQVDDSSDGRRRP